ncbi:phosphate/phosphite/phosphonate ABC transporter substrate-binding protein [Geopsychrobacter electrodiphilus]|uniref:phosphate/phosphite/phosphonate ABC transporter substrate-binding protein n=1 Tax=Geopsychrobacter electrodiphilus TaxID=225196 RepID=UPI000380E23B|nr:phosphate/phosphite/phosphonate ABC transporter substrate-binding protein [Geopsychrobacter electrodiphilus]
MYTWGNRQLYCILFFCCLCLLLQGCQQSMADQPPKQKPRTFRIGLSPELNLFEQQKLYQPLLDYLSSELGAHFEIVSLPGYRNMLDNFHKLALDGAFMGSFNGEMAIEQLGAEPIARPQYLGGASTYYGIVFVKKGSGIRNAEDMRGKRMVFVDRATTAGYLLPLDFFASLGIADYKTWFRESYFSGSHEDSILDVLNGQADVGAAKNTVFSRMSAADKRISEGLEILATSPRVPSNCLILRKDFPLKVKQLLKQRLLTLNQTSEGRSILTALGFEAFIETTANDYQPVRDYVKSVGLDLPSFTF